MSSTDVHQLQTEWTPHIGQQAVMGDSRRFRVVACGRRWGKSEMAAHLALEYGLEHPDSTLWWVAPRYDDANDYGFDTIKPLLTPDIVAETPKRTKPRKIELSTGSVLSFRSADREDSLRGGGVDLLVIDEAGSVPERAWTEELRPTLSDTLGELLAIGTPRGRNWFFDWYMRGQAPGEHTDVASWSAPTYQNPHVPDSEVDAAREELPDRIFRQEYLAEFVDDAGGVFRDVRSSVEEYDLGACTPGSSQVSADATYAIGVDFGRHEDWTVAIVLDAQTGRVVSFDRLREASWPRIKQLVENVAAQFTPNVVALDATRDNMVVTELEDAGVAVKAVTFTAKKKRTLIENLITQLESGEIILPASAPELINELEVFEYDMTETGTVRYHAPPGHHDDCVDSLALAIDAQDEARRSGREVVYSVEMD